MRHFVARDRRHLPCRYDQINGLSCFERPVILFESDPAQPVAHLTVRIGEPEVEAAGAERAVQIREKLGACKIDLRHRTEEKDDEADGIGARGQQLEQPLAHIFDIEVKERRLAPDHEDGWRSLVDR